MTDHTRNQQRTSVTTTGTRRLILDKAADVLTIHATRSHRLLAYQHLYGAVSQMAAHHVPDDSLQATTETLDALRAHIDIRRHDDRHLDGEPRTALDALALWLCRLTPHEVIDQIRAAAKALAAS